MAATGVVDHESVSQYYWLRDAGIVEGTDGRSPAEDVGGVQLLHIAHPIYFVTHKDQSFV